VDQWGEQKVLVGMQGLSTMHTNLLTDIQSLKEAGYD
jgi:hypothetical protein